MKIHLTDSDLTLEVLPFDNKVRIKVQTARLDLNIYMNAAETNRLIDELKRSKRMIISPVKLTTTPT